MRWKFENDYNVYEICNQWWHEVSNHEEGICDIIKFWVEYFSRHYAYLFLLLIINIIITLTRYLTCFLKKVRFSLNFCYSQKCVLLFKYMIWSFLEFVWEIISQNFLQYLICIPVCWNLYSGTFITSTTRSCELKISPFFIRGRALRRNSIYIILHIEWEDASM